MRVGFAIGLAALAFVAGALLSGAAAHGGGMMSGWSAGSMEAMLAACERMMASAPASGG